MSHFEDDFYDRLARVNQIQPNLFTEGINISEDFHLARSFRRGATTRATAAGVSAEDIDYINRWNIGSDASASGPMRVLYSDKRQLINAFLRFFFGSLNDFIQEQRVCFAKLESLWCD